MIISYTPGARRARPFLRALLCLLALMLVAGAATGQSAALRRGPYLQSVTPAGITIVWDTWSPTAGNLRYGPDDASATMRVNVEAATHHEVMLDGLEPDTVYHYQLFDAEGQPLTEGATFRTALPPGAADAFTFAVVGDTRSVITPHREVVGRMAAARPAFVINTGDLVGDGRRASLWDLFFELEAPLLQSAPLYPTLGNHEYEAADYFDAFVLPGDERWYAFSYGNARFICLQIDGFAPFHADSEQLAWLEAELASEATQDAAWRIVYFHMPPFTSRGNDWYEPPLRASLVPLFEHYSVDLVFNGHTHNYERNRVNGITYVISAGGGVPLYEMGAPEPTQQVFDPIHHFVLVEVEGDQLHATVIDRAGQAHDTFSLP